MANSSFQGNQHVHVSWIARKYHNAVIYAKIAAHKAVIYTKRAIVIASVITVFGYGYYAGISSKMAVADTKILFVQSTSTPPVMARIASCESGNSQLNKQGQILINNNVNGTNDIGLYQINSIHNKQATALGYDLTKRTDNIAYAMYLYENNGTGDWSSSAKCWQ